VDTASQLGKQKIKPITQNYEILQHHHNFCNNCHIKQKASANGFSVQVTRTPYAGKKDKTNNYKGLYFVKLPV
jgi:hypothetical protein